MAAFIDIQLAETTVADFLRQCETSGLVLIYISASSTQDAHVNVTAVAKDTVGVRYKMVSHSQYKIVSGAWCLEYSSITRQKVTEPEPENWDNEE